MPSYHCREKRPSEKLRKVFHDSCIVSREFSGKLHPSGSITIGKRPRSRILTKDLEYESSRGHYEFYERRHWNYQQGLVIEHKVREIKAETLGLSSVQNQHNHSERKRYGLKGISAGGRKRVREGAALLERRYGRRLGFYTLTCPYTDVESIYSYNQQISYIQRSFFQEIKRVYKRQGIAWSYVSVLEIQSERFQRTGEPVVHIHYLAPCYVPGTWVWCIEANEIRAIWQRVLSNVLGGEPPVGAAIDSSVVRTSAVGYISKYMSKGLQEVVYLAEVCPDQLPCQWWSMTSNMRKAIKEYTLHLPEDVCSFLMGHCINNPDNREYCRYMKPINVCVHGQAITVGVSANAQQTYAYKLRGRGFFDGLCEYI